MDRCACKRGPIPFGGCPKSSSFQSVAKAEAVLLPERFRGGCSFGDQVSPVLSRFVSDYFFAVAIVAEGVNREQCSSTGISLLSCGDYMLTMR
jgi:hypothetical protein